MRIFKASWFSRFAAKENIKDDDLKAIVKDVLETNQAKANLGSDVYKVRLARPGEGKSSGYRVIVFFRKRDKTFFYYAYPKSARANINEKELNNFKRVSKAYFAMTDDKITEALEAGELIEI